MVVDKFFFEIQEAREIEVGARRSGKREME